ncbi:MAG TPA: PEP-CTERM sorting domain-containing protein [Desulfuromonadales bacterium]|nr:PEP-CTERM sorting domain-containing protein [Desulfuromonadales bacterium]
MLKIFMGTVLLALSFAVSALALPYPVVQGNSVTMLSNDTAAQYEGHYQYKVGSGSTVFGAFCLELNEYFTPGSSYKVSNIASYAENGGVGGAVNGRDDLSDATKWLFYHFLNKDILAVTGNAENDYSLQLAFWKLEGELETASSYRTDFMKNTVAQDYYNDALASGSAGASYDVMAMNLVDRNGKFAQSQLVGAAPVPEPGTMMLLGFGMLGLAVYGKRRMNK